MNEEQIKKHRLRDGDVVSIGVHELVYHDLRNKEEQLQDQVNDETGEFEEDADAGLDSDKNAEDIADEKETA